LPKLFALQTVIESGPRTYPLFIGYLPAEDIAKVAAAPSFTPSTSNQAIATNILTPPIREWQRPLSQNRVQAIASVFCNAGEFMPNPVLLSENVLIPHSISVKQVKLPGGVLAPVWELEIPLPAPGDDKPLWILDGQHRISGLAQSPQRRNPVPLVLLINDAGGYFAGSDLAKIFAQVTTSAEPLDPLHDEWLTYAFRLAVYSPNTPHHTAATSAMNAVAELCRIPTAGPNGAVNPFCNQIQFNNFSPPPSPPPGGFGYNCVELKELLFRHYYNRASPTHGHLAPGDLAVQIINAHHALRAVVAAPQEKTVFFGDVQHQQRIMQDAFLLGIFTYLLEHGIPPSWTTVLRTLNFHQTPWDFASWTSTLSGPAQTLSRTLALEVFGQAFRTGALPSGTSNLADYLRGDRAEIEVICSTLTPKGRPAQVNRQTFTAQRGSVKTQSIQPRRHIRVRSATQNIARIDITDKQSPPGRLVHYDQLTRGGMTLDQSRHSNPLELLVVLNHYGGERSEISLDIQW
jgi:DGQHR domain-containing protein